MKLKCTIDPTDEYGNKVMAFTKGKEYEFEESIDPEGLETKDDNGHKEVFFNTNIMFEKS